MGINIRGRGPDREGEEKSGDMGSAAVGQMYRDANYIE